jgi:hypothetical protein
MAREVVEVAFQHLTFVSGDPAVSATRRPKEGLEETHIREP